MRRYELETHFYVLGFGCTPGRPISNVTKYSGAAKTLREIPT